jgi:multiple sugar transport system ATP-binding protein
VAGFLGAPSMNFIDGRLDGERDVQRRFAAGAFTVMLPPDCVVLAGAVTLAVRPEDIHIAPEGQLQASVTLVEPMGNHQVVWLDCGGHALSAIVHDARPLATGQAVRFDIDMARVSLFDPGSGRRL